MILVDLPTPADAVAQYAKQELLRILALLTPETLGEPAGAGAGAAARVAIVLSVNPDQPADQVHLHSSPDRIVLAGGSSAALLNAVYLFFEKLGCVFDFSGERLPPPAEPLRFPVGLNLCQRPAFAERGIRMHLNFVQDQSFFSEEEFAAFIDNLARLRFNYLLFHMYTPQQWFPFTYRGVPHLDLQLGNLNRKPLAAGMIGREKVKVREHWFPREFETLRDPAELLAAVYERFRRMMARAHDRGVRNCVAFEPESLPPALAARLPEWSASGPAATLTNDDLTKVWQEEWSGTRLAEPDVRHPLVIDIAVERCLQCLDAFPDLDELQLISREGTAWRPKAGQNYEQELARLATRFNFPPELIDRQALTRVVPPDDGPEMNAKAHPYWTVLPGDTFQPTVLGTLRYVEFALAVLADPRVKAKLAARKLASSIAVYSPNPETIRLIMPAVARMLPAGTRFHCLADYGAHDIAANLPAWQPLAAAGMRIGVVSWLEFDGTMMLAQSWVDSICENAQAAKRLGAESLYFNHWRVRSLEHNAAMAAAMGWSAGQSADAVKRDYYARLFGVENTAKANDAYRLLEEATLYAKSWNYNIGFTGNWVFRNSTDVPGYYWRRLIRSRDNFQRASDAFEALARSSAHLGQRQAQYLADLCRISALHVQAVYHLQNAKLPLFGYKAWPVTQEHASWPPPEKLEGLVKDAEIALDLEKEYMRVYAKWVKGCDEQGQLCLHHQGVIEPFAEFATALAQRLKEERKPK